MSNKQNDRFDVRREGSSSTELHPRRRIESVAGQSEAGAVRSEQVVDGKVRRSKLATRCVGGFQRKPGESSAPKGGN